LANNIVHFAIHADDVARARAFYEGAFGWRFEAWGPPDFFRVFTGDAESPGIEGALEKRQAPLLNEGTTGFTCTISVADITAARAAVEGHGGTIRYEGEIPTVGKIIQFADTEGNLVSAMQYEDRLS